ncbi:MAG: 6-phosphogluconate dehydrogenase, NAD(+)-dependent, decarboxylating [Candidatus Dependentiae bacterium ADurb.Bin331]|nr:MAG: 6-phosphogluconate dehydrogenase, NAD(+)-dependent, decarboxylating [Candidatus Dependentiae bacterium ADurb.Bin331]
MNCAVIGLGRMGSAIVYRLLKAGHAVVGYDPSAQARQEAATVGATIVSTLEECAHHAQIMWLMVPAGPIVDQVLRELLPHLNAGAVVIDGGNSKFSDSIRRFQELKSVGIEFLDCGTSGGLHGKEIGFSLMIGGDIQAFQKVEPIFTAIAAPQGYGLVGPSGCGHYVKMVHNGIEYALLQSYAEGLQLLNEGEFKDLDLAKITNIWQHGSIIRSWILELTHEILKKDQKLEKISGTIAESGTGSWTVEEAHKQKVPVKLIEDALEIRAWSRESGGNYATKLVALMRNAFGGHALGMKNPPK